MDNLTHTLVGLAAAKAGLERVSPYATTVCMLAANAPDADIVAVAGGRWYYLQHHRGITHSIVGVIAIALLLPLGFYLADRLIARWRGRPPRVRLGALTAASLVASATHPLLDWTNNYGVRPFLPWSGKWYYGDLVFIIDPWLWLLLGGAAFLATAGTKARTALWAVLGLALTAVFLFLPLRGAASITPAAKFVWVAWVAALAAARRLDLGARWGLAVPAVALALVPAYWGALAVFHARALGNARAAAATLSAPAGETVGRVAAMPTLANPTLWRVVAETDRASHLFNVSTSGAAPLAAPGPQRFERLRGPDAERVARLAQTDYAARVFLDFARFPLAGVTRAETGEARAQLVDLRFVVPGASTRPGSFAVELPLPAEGR